MQPSSNYPPSSGWPYPNAPASAPPPRKSGGGCGCFGSGCLIVLGVLLLLGLVLGVGGFFVAKKFRENLTADHAVPVPIFPATDAQYSAVAARLRAFSNALNAHQAAALELSADDLNTLVAKDPDYADLRGKVFFTIEQALLGVQASAPLGDMPIVGTLFRGRYFNGKASGEITVSQGTLRFVPHTLEANGKRLGPDAMKGLTTRFDESLQREIRRRPDAVNALRRIDTLDVSDGKVRMVSRGS
jgi:hypothetical protein